MGSEITNNTGLAAGPPETPEACQAAIDASRDRERMLRLELERYTREIGDRIDQENAVRRSYLDRKRSLERAAAAVRPHA